MLIPFEQFVLNTYDFIEKINILLETSSSKCNSPYESISPPVEQISFFLFVTLIALNFDFNDAIMLLNDVV